MITLSRALPLQLTIFLILATAFEPFERNNKMQYLTSQQPSSCPFFSRLPPEIRSQIYLEAFGGRTIHLQRSYYSDEAKTTTGFLRFWWANMCVLDPWTDPFDDEGRHVPNCGGHNDYDACNMPAANFGQSKVLLEMIGWFLSCRQAYAESIDVFYKCNNFVVGPCIKSLNAYEMPQRFKTISSLVVAWHQIPHWMHDPADNWIGLDSSLVQVHRAFPGLSRLCLIVRMSFDPSDTNMESDRESTIHGLLEPIDTLMTLYRDSGLRTFQTAFPLIFHKPFTTFLEKHSTIRGSDEEGWRYSPRDLLRKNSILPGTQDDADTVQWAIRTLQPPVKRYRKRGGKDQKARKMADRPQTWRLVYQRWTDDSEGTG